MRPEQKFLFDTCFESPAPDATAPEPQVPEEPESQEPEITEADVEQARQEGRTEGIELGRAQGRTEAFEGIEQVTQDLLAKLAGRLGDLIADQSQRYENLSRDTLKTATTVVTKLLPSLEKSAALKEIESVVSDCLARAHDEPRLVIRVADTMLEQVKTRVDSLVEAEGFEGKIVFLAADDLGSSDVRVEWADGGAERRNEDIRQEIDQVLARFLKRPAGVQTPVPASNPVEEASPPPLVSALDQMGLEVTGTGLPTGPAAAQSNSDPANSDPANSDPTNSDPTNSDPTNSAQTNSAPTTAGTQEFSHE